jgi:polysaccharide export outer membrane protein
MKAKSILLLLALCCFAATAAAQSDGSGGGGSASQVPVVNTSSSGTASMDAMGIKKYLLGPGDVLDLRVYNEPQFNGTLIVNDEGNLEVPFVETPIPAQCRSDREIKQDVVKALSKYLNKPQVSLQIREMRSRPPAVVFGAVRAPSRVQMQRRVRLLDLLATTGGVTESAGGNIQVFHTEPLLCPDPEEDIAKPVASFAPGDATEVRYDLYSLTDLKLGKPEANPVMRPGDIIIVTEAQPIYITGAVVAPQGVYLRDGKMSLKQAIAMVGGLRREAKASAIIIWRNKKDSKEPEKMVINFNDIKKEKSPDIALMPYDIIEVPDNSGSLGIRLRDMVIGGASGGITSVAQTLPLRVIY